MTLTRHPLGVSVYVVPSGRVHNLINTLTLLGLGSLAGYAQGQKLVDLEPGAVTAFTGAYLAGTYLLSPDLDLAEQHVSTKRNWGPLGFLWVPYGWVFSHRGLSHTWLVGPLTRLIYLALLLALPVLLLRDPILNLQLDGVTRGPLFDLLKSFQGFWLKPSIARDTLIALALGYYVSQWLHLIADGVAPDLNVSFSRRRRR
jgi:uncharacterized metal-binding protein